MANLRISPELLLQALFPDQIDLVLHGASYDPMADLVTLDLSGSGVPDVPEVVAWFTVERRSTVFRPRGGS